MAETEDLPEADEGSPFDFDARPAWEEDIVVTDETVPANFSTFSSGVSDTVAPLPDSVRGGRMGCGTRVEWEVDMEHVVSVDAPIVAIDERAEEVDVPVESLIRNWHMRRDIKASSRNTNALVILVSN